MQDAWINRCLLPQPSSGQSITITSGCRRPQTHTRYSYTSSSLRSLQGMVQSLNMTSATPQQPIQREYWSKVIHTQYSLTSQSSSSRGVEQASNFFTLFFTTFFTIFCDMQATSSSREGGGTICWRSVPINSHGRGYGYGYGYGHWV